MLSVRRLLDRFSDRRPVIRRARTRRRSPWRLIALLAGVVALILVAVLWLRVEPMPVGPSIRITTSAAGVHYLDGKPVTQRELETVIAALRTAERPLFVVIEGPRRRDGIVWPSPEVEAVLRKLDQSWMSASQDEGGEHGR